MNIELSEKIFNQKKNIELNILFRSKYVQIETYWFWNIRRPETSDLQFQQMSSFV